MKRFISYCFIFFFIILCSCTEAKNDIVDSVSDGQEFDGLDFMSDDGPLPDGIPDADSTDALDSHDPVPEPSEACRVDEVSENAAIEIVPPHPRPDIQLTFNVTSSEGYTNVKLLLCGPDGMVTPDGPDVYPGSPNLWVWTANNLDQGIYQAQFSADPGDTVYRTLTFTVEENPADADGDGYTSESSGGDDCNDEDHTIHPGADDICGDSIDQDCSGSDAACDFCDSPAGNIISHGEFEEGMDGQAPTGWQVRNPSMPGECPGSPDSHVYLGPPPSGCSGSSLTIDAGGTWDCYAVQIVSDYSTIEAGHTYRISAVVRSQGNAVNPAAWFIIGVQWLDAGDNFFGDDKNPATTSADENDFDWKVFSFDLVAPAGAVRILVWLTAHYPGRVDYDNIAVVRVD